MMNPRESQLLCKFCSVETGIYTCPKCDIKYCSSQCYKHVNHSECSEQFFREWVETSTHEMFDIEQKKKILGMIKNSERLCDKFENGESSLAHRFSTIDFDSTSEDVIWNQLTQEEKDSFKKFCNDEEHLSNIIQVQKPWWDISKIKYVAEVVSENDNNADSVAQRPCFPLNIKKLSMLTSISPSECIQYNLINILYTYAFMFKFHNSDLRDLIEDVVESIIKLSPVLSKGVNYLSLDEAVQNSLSLVTSVHNISFAFAKSIVSDVCKLLQGPSNAQPITYVLCALQDLKLLFLKMKQMSKKVGTNIKIKKQLLSFAVKKVEYLMSWSLDHPDFEDLAMKLYFVLLPDSILEPIECEDISKNVALPQKPLIEEINS